MVAGSVAQTDSRIKPRHTIPDVPRRVTLQTIADVLGVSRSTVSNAYNRPDQLAPDLRERILAVAADLGYTGPDPAARRLRTGRSGVIGLLFTEALSYAFTDPAAVGFLEGLAREAEVEGTALLLVPSPPGADAAHAVREAVVDGLCIYSMADDQAAVRAALERRIPTVVVEEPDIEGQAFVGIDDRSATREVAEHVLGLGHRDVAVLTDRLRPDGYEGPVDPAREAGAAFHIGRQRLHGFRDALAAVGIDWATVPKHEGPNDREAGARLARAALAATPRPTALMAATDQLALGALRAAAELGMAVPGDLSVTGFDDAPPAALADLTTLRQPLREKGEQAARLLAELREGGPPRRVMLPVELIVRGSTGPVRASDGREVAHGRLAPVERHVRGDHLDVALRREIGCPGNPAFAPTSAWMRLTSRSDTRVTSALSRCSFASSRSSGSSWRPAYSAASRLSRATRSQAMSSSPDASANSVAT